MISVGEYLNTTYRPDQELVDGRLVERNLGEFDHSSMQGGLVARFHSHQREWKIRVLPEQRVQVSSTRFRVPDVTILSREQPIEPFVTNPPLIVIEVLSKDDTLRSLQDRVDDYRAFGVPHIWVLDPSKRRAYIANQGDFREPPDQILEIPGSPIRISLFDLFAELDAD